MSDLTTTQTNEPEEQPVVTAQTLPSYQKPAIIFEGKLEAQAGSPVLPYDPILGIPVPK